MTLPSTDYHPHPERTDAEFEKLHNAYHDALEIIAHRDYRVAELESENASLRALTIRQANQLRSYVDENSRLHQLLASYQQQVSRLAEHIDADHAYLRQTLGNGGVISAHNPNLPPDIRTMFAGEAAAARKQVAADDGPEAVTERTDDDEEVGAELRLQRNLSGELRFNPFGSNRYDLELFNSGQTLAAIGPKTIDS